MPVQVTFKCSGCWEAEAGPFTLGKRFQSFDGKGYGWGQYRYDQPADVVPEGWVAYCPYTGCCYCPECWQLIEETMKTNEDEVSDDQEQDSVAGV